MGRILDVVKDVIGTIVYLIPYLVFVYLMFLLAYNWLKPENKDKKGLARFSGACLGVGVDVWKHIKFLFRLLGEFAVKINEAQVKKAEEAKKGDVK